MADLQLYSRYGEMAALDIGLAMRGAIQ